MTSSGLVDAPTDYVGPVITDQEGSVVVVWCLGFKALFRMLDLSILRCVWSSVWERQMSEGGSALGVEKFINSSRGESKIINF